MQDVFVMCCVPQAVFRQDDTNGGVAEALAIEMRHLSSENSPAKADAHSERRE